jgi:hypothetical protein
MHWSGMVSMACLVITAGLATWGVFSKHFHDNLGQCIGLSIVGIACYLRMPIKWEQPVTPPEILMAQIGLCIFGLGTAGKLWRRNRQHHDRRKRPRL